MEGTTVHSRNLASEKLLKRKLNEFAVKLPWIETLDLVNAPAPLAPELVLQMQEQEIRRSKELKGNKKLKQYNSAEDPVLNEFRRETMFYRQAQGAVLEAVERLKQLNIPIIRPDDYFAEMVKSDDHMQKVRENLMKKQFEAQRSEKVRKLRAQSKISKQMQVEAKLQKSQQSKKSEEKIKMKNKKFGFGGKKKDSKRNTKASSADVMDYRRPFKPGKGKGKEGKGKEGKGKEGKNKRFGKNRRLKMKAKKN